MSRCLQGLDVCVGGGDVLAQRFISKETLDDLHHLVPADKTEFSREEALNIAQTMRNDGVRDFEAANRLYSPYAMLGAMALSFVAGLAVRRRK